MMASYFNKILTLMICISCAWAYQTQAGDSFLTRYVRQHNFMPDDPTYIAIKPHEEVLDGFQEIFDKIEKDTGLKMEVEEILNGGVLGPVSDDDIWLYMRGGDIIGGGGGIVEQGFDYHFTRIPKYIEDCLSSQKACGMNDFDSKTLLKISEILAAKAKDPNRIIYLSGAQYPLLFEEPGSPWGARTAKTGDSPETPILINSDHLYENGIPALGDKDIITFIVHETGHQAKVKDHGYLTRLGNDLVAFLEQNSYQLTRHYAGVEHTVQVLNFESAYRYSEASLTVGKDKIDLKPALRDSLHCWHPDQKVIGFDLSNIHWQRESVENNQEVFPVGLWATVNCRNQMNRMIYKRDVDLKLKLMFSRDALRQLEEIQVEVQRD